MWQVGQLTRTVSAETRDLRIAPSTYQALGYLTAAAVLGTVAGYMTEWLAELSYGERKQMPLPHQAQSLKQLAAITAMQSQALLPPMLAAASALPMATSGTRYGANFGMNLVGLTLAQSIGQTIQGMYQTGDPVRPGLDFIRQWFPNTRVIINRLPEFGYSGLVQVRNVSRDLRTAGYLAGIEIRQGAGAAMNLTSVSPVITAIVNELGKPSVDMGRVMELREQAAQMHAAQGDAHPYQAVDSAVAGRAPMRAVFGKALTPDQMAKVESVLPARSQEQLHAQAEAFEGYAQMARANRPSAAGTATARTVAGGLPAAAPAMAGGIGMGRATAGAGAVRTGLGGVASRGGARRLPTRLRGLRSLGIKTQGRIRPRLSRGASRASAAGRLSRVRV